MLRHLSSAQILSAVLVVMAGWIGLVVLHALWRARSRALDPLGPEVPEPHHHGDHHEHGADDAAHDAAAHHGSKHHHQAGGHD